MELNFERPLRKYESIVILHPDCSEEEQKEFFRKNKKILSDYSGEFNCVETWGKRRLGNPIDKIRMGIYFYSTFESKAECIAELERTMRINDKVLRYHHKRLDDRKTIAQHTETYREMILESKKREQEREKAFQQKKAAKMRK